MTFDKRLGLDSSSSRPRVWVTDMDLRDNSPPLLFDEFVVVFLNVIVPGRTDLLFVTERRPLLTVDVKLGPPVCWLDLGEIAASFC